MMRGMCVHVFEDRSDIRVAATGFPRLFLQDRPLQTTTSFPLSIAFLPAANNSHTLTVEMITDVLRLFPPSCSLLSSQ